MPLAPKTQTWGIWALSHNADLHTLPVEDKFCIHLSKMSLTLQSQPGCSDTIASDTEKSLAFKIMVPAKKGHIHCSLTLTTK